MRDSKDSDQPVRLRSLIRVFADRVHLLQPKGYSKRNEQKLLQYVVDVQADLSLCWSHRSYCWFWLTFFYVEICATRLIRIYLAKSIVICFMPIQNLYCIVFPTNRERTIKFCNNEYKNNGTFICLAN